MRILRSVCLFGVLLGAVACKSAGRKAAWEKTAADAKAPMAETSSTTLSKLAMEGDAAWAKRDSKAEVEKALAAWESLVQANPKDAETMIKLARGYYFLVDGHIGIEGSLDDDAQKALYQKGVDWGEKALLILEPEFEKTMRADGEFIDAIKKINKPGMPAAYWYCTNLGRFAVKSGLQAKLFYKDRVAAAMGRIRELDENYFYRAADRYFGAFYSALPSIAGKDVDKSKKHFKFAVEGAPQYLPNKVVKAQFLAVELDDEDMYKQLLDEVIKADAGSDADIGPENRAAQRAAKKMLADIDDTF